MLNVYRYYGKYHLLLLTSRSIRLCSASFAAIAVICLALCTLGALDSILRLNITVMAAILRGIGNARESLGYGGALGSGRGNRSI